MLKNSRKSYSPSVRKLSKIATLLLAKNYIMMQANTLDELRKVVTCMSKSNGLYHSSFRDGHDMMIDEQIFVLAKARNRKTKL